MGKGGLVNNRSSEKAFKIASRGADKFKEEQQCSAYRRAV